LTGASVKLDQLSREEARMANEDKVKGPASYFPSIEKTYGKPIAHWMDVLRDAGEMKHMEYVALLKSSHPGRFMVWNVSEEGYEYSMLNDQVEGPAHTPP
jgi:hypothetical protein